MLPARFAEVAANQLGQVGTDAVARDLWLRLGEAALQRHGDRALAIMAAASAGTDRKTRAALISIATLERRGAAARSAASQRARRCDVRRDTSPARPVRGSLA